MTQGARRSLPVVVTMGDPAGIGPEITVKVIADPDRTVPAIVVGDPEILKRTNDQLSTRLEVIPIAHPSEATLRPGTLDVIAGSNLPADLPTGRIDVRAGVAASDYIKIAIGLALEDSVSAVVTAPINKEALKAAKVPYLGHTEMFADLTGTRDYAMMLFNDELRVILVTVHVALVEAIGQLTTERELRVIRLADRAARSLGVSAPRIAVAGVNPHAGEGGLFGQEEINFIHPAIQAARAEGIDASGPWPGDTVFMQARQGRFDIVVAQYHDQGLIPVKYLGIEEGVNVTVGLPFIRTSVDHGTAFDIAGKGMADHRSLRVAIEQAALMAARQR